VGVDGEFVFHVVSSVACRRFEANVSVLIAKFRRAVCVKLYLEVIVLKNVGTCQAETRYFGFFLSFVDRASWYNLVNKTSLVHNFLVCLFLFSTCFGQLCAHHQEK